MWKLLTNRHQTSSGWDPPLPLILSAWYVSSPQQKQMRLEQHIRHAEINGQLIEIANYLTSLSEDDWFHVSD